MKPIKLITGTAAGMAIVGAGLWFAVGRDIGAGFANCSDAAITGGTAAIGGAFTLVDETGTTVTDTQVFARPSLVFFGYTQCPDECPLAASRNADVVDILANRGFDVQPVFITFDPAHDTPDVLAEFTDLFHADMLGLTGTPEQIQATSDVFKVYFEKQPGDNADLFDHSTYSYLILPKSGFADFFRNDESAAEIADKAACYLKNMGSEFDAPRRRP